MQANKSSANFSKEEVFCIQCEIYPKSQPKKKKKCRFPGTGLTGLGRTHPNSSIYSTAVNEKEK